MTYLITSTLRNGIPGGPATVSISAKEKDVIFKVRNEGPPNTEEN